MTLADFIAGEKKDGNLFWRLPCGDHQNLLEEAIDRIAELEAENVRLKSMMDRAVRLTDTYAGQLRQTRDGAS